MNPRIIFVTGTDTGVGKTLLTALLLCHLRQARVGAHAIKPFCSGDREDAKLFHSLQDGEFGLAEINPFAFPQPLAPGVAGRKNGCRIRPAQVLEHIRSICLLQRKISHSDHSAPTLLIEGIGGILVPLGERFDVLDLVRKLDCDSIVVARNQLGTINHTRCTVRVMQDAGVQRIKVVLMGVAKADLSTKSNPGALAELLAPIPVVSVPFLGKKALSLRRIRSASKNLKKSLAQLEK